MLAIIQFWGGQKVTPKFEKPKCVMLRFLFLTTIYQKCINSVMKNLTKVRLDVLFLPSQRQNTYRPHSHLVFIVSGSEVSHLDVAHWMVSTPPGQWRAVGQSHLPKGGRRTYRAWSNCCSTGTVGMAKAWRKSCGWRIGGSSAHSCKDSGQPQVKKRSGIHQHHRVSRERGTATRERLETGRERSKKIMVSHMQRKDRELLAGIVKNIKGCTTE